jgi:hypothetical protein
MRQQEENMAQTEVKWRYVRNKATGKVDAVSTNKAKKLVKTGSFVEVPPPDGKPALPPINAQLPPASRPASSRALLLLAASTLGIASIAIAAMILRIRGFI